MVAGFSIPLYMVLTVIGGVAMTLLLPYPLYKPGVTLCVFSGKNAMARTVINTLTAFLSLMMVTPLYEYWNMRYPPPSFRRSHNYFINYYSFIRLCVPPLYHRPLAYSRSYYTGLRISVVKNEDSSFCPSISLFNKDVLITSTACKADNSWSRKPS